MTRAVDDDIVVDRSGNGARRKGIYVLKDKLSHDGLIELDTALDVASHLWKEQVVETTADRFERRLAQELSAVRIEIAGSRLSMIRWMAGLLLAQAGVIIGTVFAMMTFLVNALKP